MPKNIRNHCEVWVFERINAMPNACNRGVDFINDVACIALNSLKPRYIREPIFLFYHLTDIEWQEIHADIAAAVDMAIKHIEKNLRTAGNRDVIALGTNYLPPKKAAVAPESSC